MVRFQYQCPTLINDECVDFGKDENFRNMFKTVITYLLHIPNNANCNVACTLTKYVLNLIHGMNLM